MPAPAARAIEPFARALVLLRMGSDPDETLLCVRLETAERYEVGGELDLIDMAEAAAGVPPAGKSPMIRSQGPAKWHSIP